MLKPKNATMGGPDLILGCSHTHHPAVPHVREHQNIPPQMHFLLSSICFLAITVSFLKKLNYIFVSCFKIPSSVGAIGLGAQSHSWGNELRKNWEMDSVGLYQDSLGWNEKKNVCSKWQDLQLNRLWIRKQTKYNLMMHLRCTVIYLCSISEGISVMLWCIRSVQSAAASHK